MMSPTHHLVGGSTAFVATTALNAPTLVVAVAVAGATAASSLPDVDQRIKLLPHRGLTHYPILQIAFFAALGALAAAWAPEFRSIIVVLAMSMALGCVMHSVADAMTIERNGIRLLWPLSRRGYHLMPWSLRTRVGSESRSERVFVAVWVLAVLIYAYAHFGPQINA